MFYAVLSKVQMIRNSQILKTTFAGRFCFTNINIAIIFINNARQVSHRNFISVQELYAGFNINIHREGSEEIFFDAL